MDTKVKPIVSSEKKMHFREIMVQSSVTSQMPNAIRIHDQLRIKEPYSC